MVHPLCLTQESKICVLKTESFRESCLASTLSQSVVGVN